MKLKAWSVIVLQALLLGVPLFAAAGTLRWHAAWLFLAVVIAASTLTNLMLAARDPALLEDRNKSLVRRDQSGWDRLLLPSLILLSVGWLVAMGLDAQRFHLSHMPSWLQLAGVSGIVGGMWIRFRSLRENTFLSTVMKIQTERNHTVISTGPYARVR
jgi:protein-S-isoprenylcysteine O-methyltransferase Ste14